MTEIESAFLWIVAIIACPFTVFILDEVGGEND